MKVGDYVRTIYGIAKIEKIKQDEVHKTNWYTVDKAQYHSFLARQQEIIKSSPRIIELIQVGDYVNGEKVVDKFDYLLEFGDGQDGNWYIRDDEIKSIVTKEQFESISYEVK